MSRSIPRLISIGLATLACLVPYQAHAEDHTVVSGDTLGGIAEKYHCSIKAIKAANNLRGTIVRIGQVIEIPKDGCDEGSSSGRLSAKGPVTVSHEVLSGETLADIATRYLTTESEIVRLNGAKRVKRLRAGQRIKVRTPDPERAQVKTKYKIEPGDTLTGIASRYDLGVSDLMRMNPRKKADSLRIGDTLYVYSDVRISKSKAIGRPQNGRLVDGIQLPDGPGYFVRRKNRNYGTADTIRALQNAFFAVKKRLPRVHDIVVGDISKKDGGRLAPHKSHQTGIDADIGFYFHNQKPAGPKVALDAQSSKLDLEATWALIEEFVGASADKSRVDYMFIGYGVQEKLYRYAESKGESKKKLAWLFQYPRGSRAMHGLIRHEPGHTNHIHIRFKCPRHNKECL